MQIKNQKKETGVVDYQRVDPALFISVMETEKCYHQLAPHKRQQQNQNKNFMQTKNKTKSNKKQKTRVVGYQRVDPALFISVMKTEKCYHQLVPHKRQQQNQNKTLCKSRTKNKIKLKTGVVGYQRVDPALFISVMETEKCYHQLACTTQRKQQNSKQKTPTTKTGKQYHFW
jgi:hypothetical protein